MIRIILADDEYLARENLKITLSRVTLPNQVVGEAQNGRELLELVNERKPDAVLVDIRMPEMDGLKSIQYGKKLSPKTQWIIISGFSEFDYASRAIELSVSSYLLKPLKTDELEKALRKVFASSCWQDQQLFRESLRKYFDGLDTKETEKQFEDYKGFYAAIFLIDSSLPETVQKQMSSNYFEQLQNLLQNLEIQPNSLLFALPSGEMTLVLGWKEATGKANVSPIRGKIARSVPQWQYPDFSVSVLETDGADSLLQLRERISSVQESACLRFITSETVLSQHDLQLLSGSTPKLKQELCAAVQELANAYRIHSFLFYSKAVDSLRQALARAELTITEKLNILRSLKLVTGVQSDQADPADDMEAFVRLLLNRGHTMIQTSISDNESLMEDVITYIDQNYMKELSVNDLADLFHISPSYFSILFKRTRKETFLKYLTRVRMIKAKELLLNQKLSIQTVAGMVGYQSARYFTKLFHESYHIYPSDYRGSGQKD